MFTSSETWGYDGPKSMLDIGFIIPGRDTRVIGLYIDNTGTLREE